MMKSVLKSWFQDPRLLNLTSPKLKYPFSFNDWKRVYYGYDGHTFVLKKERWIIGHLSLKFNSKSEIKLFHLITDPQHQREGYATKLILETEKLALVKKKKLINSEILKNNHTAIVFFKKQGFQKTREKKNSFVFTKRIIV